MYIYRIVHQSHLTIKTEGEVQRTPQYLTSRSALKEALEELTGNQWHEDQLKIKDYHRLIEQPEILVSLSHTSEYGAAVVSNDDKIIGLGIDIESKDRTFNPKIEKFFRNERDDQNEASRLLELWTMKEAAFKAISPISLNFTKKSPLVLKDIWVKGHAFGIDENNLGKVELCEENNLITAIAKVF